MLRDYQQEAMKKTIAFIHEGEGNGIIAACPSAGKSILIAQTAEYLHENEQRVLILADRAKLIKQNFSKFTPTADVGIVSASLDKYDYDKNIVIAGIQTVYNKADLIGRVDWVLIDESHAVGNDFTSDSRYHQLLRHYPHARIIGYSGTPYSLAEGQISWGKIIYEISYAELLAKGFCVPLTNKICDEPDLDTVDKSGKEYNLLSLGKFMRDPALIERTAKKTAEYLTKANRKKAIAFCVDLEHAAAMHLALKEAGIYDVWWIHGGMKEKEKEEVLHSFEHGETQVLLNVELITKGVDLPCVDCIIWYRPTESLALWEQGNGRGIRLYEGKKDCLLLDFTGNLRKFGTMGNPIWKYYGSEKKKIGKALKICPACEGEVNIGRESCSHCEYVFIKEDVKRELKHQAVADLNSDLTNPHQMERYYNITKVLYSDHYATSGKRSLRVEYLSGRFSVSEYLKFGSKSGWDVSNCVKFIRPRSNIMPESIDEALELCHKWKLPQIIKVRPQKGNAKYWELAEITKWQDT